jgi:xylulokinase
MITLGIDIGTSSVKAALVERRDDGLELIVASASRPLTVSRPRPGYSEQDPEAWWQATVACVDQLQATSPRELASCTCIGLSGQMHGAVLLDAGGTVLRPCILWNDGRSERQCGSFEAAWPVSRRVTGNLAMPGFTAPKLIWVRENEPQLFERIDRVLLPKAYVRWRLCGEAVEDMSDASGTLWLDVARRSWSTEALAACGLGVGQMPRLVEGNAVAGLLGATLARRWGMPREPLVAGGAGDNAAGAVAVGAVDPGDAFVSLGTSGVIWATTASFRPRPERGVHAFCHALPQRWHQMGVVLHAAASLAWWSQVCGREESVLLAELNEASATGAWFLPYLSGERTPHNDAAVRGGFLGVDATAGRPDLTRAVLEGVAYALRDAAVAVASAGSELTEADLIGGGARSAFWCQLMADVLAIPLHTLVESDLGCALGAARLAWMAASGADPSALARPVRSRTFEPRAAATRYHDDRFVAWRELYPHAAAVVRPSRPDRGAADPIEGEPT